MARTKQRARKYLGLAPDDNIRRFKDHTNKTYTVAGGRPYDTPNPNIIRKLSVQLYCLDTPSPSPAALATSFLTADIFGCDYQPRVDIYTTCTTIEQCISHHLAEKAHRQRANQKFRTTATKNMNPEIAHDHLTTHIRGFEPLPHIVPTWCCSSRFWTENTDIYGHSRYRNWILVLPKGVKSFADAQKQGITLVDFDLDWTPAMETELVDIEPCPLVRDNRHHTLESSWLIIDAVPKPPLVKTTTLCIRDEPRRTLTLDTPYPNPNFYNPDGSFNPAAYNEYHHGWKTPGSKATLHDLWRETTSRALNDCTYRNVFCEGCRADEAESHDRCEWELDEHYFDDDGQCIECRRFLEYRRRSKRIAGKRKREDIEVD